MKMGGMVGMQAAVAEEAGGCEEQREQRKCKGTGFPMLTVKRVPAATLEFHC